MLDKILEMLKNEKTFVSGEEMAKNLNVSRNAICKNIAKLRKMGYNIISSTNKGYMLDTNINLYNEIEIKKALKTNLLGKKIYFFDELDSTNRYAKDIALKDENGSLVLCNNQVNGKGRLDRAWVGSSDKNIYSSLILKPNIELINVWQVTLLTGLALCKAIGEITDKEILIKWPNDIILNGRKISGILTEVNAQIDRVLYIVLGIGINVNEDNFPTEVKEKATSIYLEIGKTIDRTDLLCRFLEILENIYLDYLENGEFEKYILEYKKLCLSLGKEVRIISNNNTIEGKILDISNLGHLIVENEKGESIVVSGEVSIRNKNGEYI